MAYQGKQLQSNIQKRHGGGSGGARPPQPPRPPKPPRPPRPKRKIRWGRILLVLIVFTLVMGMTGLAGYGWYLQRKVVDVTQPTTPIAKSQPVNVLLIGLDRDPHGDPARQREMNTDTLILAHIDPEKHAAYLLSIPRDTRVELPTGWDKINAAYATGGMDRLQRTVQDLTGLTVDRYVMIDFPAFVQAIDAIGGVQFQVDKPITDPEGTVSLQPGTQQLNGKQALAVVRFRHEQLGDIARVKRQQQFLQALGDKLKQTNVVDFMKALRAVSDSLQTNMTISEMGMLATSLQSKDAKITANTVPGDFLDLYGVSYWKVNTDELHALLASQEN